jgi:hypothetical protein
MRLDGCVFSLASVEPELSITDEVSTVPGMGVIVPLAISSVATVDIDVWWVGRIIVSGSTV